MDADWVELRVHGVSGTPPEDLLGSAHVRQVAGGDRSRFFRPAGPQGQLLPAPDGHLLEGFHWGRWTSGSWTQALWLLLIPFGIVNAAQFMLPGPTSPAASRWHTISGGLLRLVALVLTVLFAAATAELLVDLVAWQWLGQRQVAVVGGRATPVVLALLVSGALVGLLAALGRMNVGDRQLFPESADGTRATGRLPGLTDAEFFNGDPDSPSLRALHGSAGLLAVSLLGFLAPGSSSAWAWVGGGAVVGALVLLGAVVVLLGDPEHTVSPTPGGPGGRRAGWHATIARVRFGLVVVAAGAVVLSCVAVAQLGDPGPRPPGSMPGVGTFVVALTVVGTAALTLLLGSVGALAAATRADDQALPAPFRRLAGGWTAACAASIGTSLAVGLTAALSLTVQALLNRGDGPQVQAPVFLQRVSFAWGVSAGVVLLLALVPAGALRARRAADRSSVGRQYAFAERSRRPTTIAWGLRTPWQRRVARAMGLARLKNGLAPAVVVLTVCGMVLSLVICCTEVWAFVSTSERVDPPPPFNWLTGTASGPGDPVTGDDVLIAIGSGLLLALGAGTVAVSRGAIRSERARRGLNVVWDVVAFWPRSVHPFVPPPYAQQVVPGLVRRLSWHLGTPCLLSDPEVTGPAAVNPRPAQRVVLAAHSQGSLISLVALLWLREQDRERVGWVTFGSQLRMQFPRAFPHYVRVADLRTALTEHRWVSLYRETDPIAGPVTSWGRSPDGPTPHSYRLAAPEQLDDDWVDPVTGRRVCGSEWRLLDPPAADLGQQLAAVDRIRGHAQYWADPDWPLALAVARGAVPDGRVSRSG